MEATTGSGISLEELQLAARNHGMPLEALRHAITPVGLHYLLIHFDVPVVDGATWRLEVDGEVERPLSLSLDELKRRAAVERTVTMECAGNGRARLDPRPVSQPWLAEAIGTAASRGGVRWSAGHADPSARAAGAARSPRLLHPRTQRPARPGRTRGPRVVGARAGGAGRSERRRRRDVVGRDTRGRPRLTLGLVPVD